MKLKSFNSLLVAVLLTGLAGCFTSCKDTNEDDYNNVMGEISYLQKRIEEVACKCQLVDNGDGSYTLTVNGNSCKILKLSDLELGLVQNIIDNWGNYDPADFDGLKIDGALAKAYNAWKTSDGKWHDVQEILDYIDKLASLDQVKALSARLASIEDVIKVIDERINSIEIQQVSNPIFGSLAVPFDIKNMMLFNWYPEYTGSVRVGGESVAPVTTDVKLGTIRFSVNPTSIDLTDSKYTVELINSLGESIEGLTIENIKPCEEALKFYTRADETLVWEADVKVADLDAVRVYSGVDFVSSVKDAIKQKSLSTVSSMGGIVLESLKNMNNQIDAQGIRISWEEPVNSYDPTADGNGVYPNTTTGDIDDNPTAEESKKFSVVSSFNMAAFSVHPLGTTTLDVDGQWLDLPELPDFQAAIDKVKDKVNATFDEYKNQLKFEFKYDPIDVSLEIPEIEITIDFNADEITYEYYDPRIDKVVTEKVKNIDQLVSNIQNSIKESMGEFSDELGDNFDAMLVDLNDQLSAIINSLAEEVNGKIADVMADIQQKTNDGIDAIANRIENFYTLFEKIYNKSVDLANNPGKLLHPCLLYKNGTNIGRLSQSQAVPSTFVLDGGNAITLIPTTWNCQLISPIYKKAIVIDGKPLAGCNCPMNGEQMTVACELTPGDHTIVYEALDYRGQKTTLTYYVTVK